MGRAARIATLISAVLWGGIACQRGDALTGTVRAPTPRALTTWRARIASDTSVETRRQVEEAFQEIRLRAAGDREIKRHGGETVAAGSDSIDEAVCQRVDGKPLREVVQLGYELRVGRIKRELAALEDAMHQNSQLVTKPGDLESRHHLDALRERQTGRLEKYRAELVAAEREVAALAKVTGRQMIDPATEASLTAMAEEKPDQMPERLPARKR